MEQSTLFSEVQLGDFHLKNRFVVAPLTRNRADAYTFVPNDLLVEHYAQRAGFGLIITECSQVSNLSNALHYSGGIYSQEQVVGWKKVTDAVHKKGGLIALQIWHCGRAANFCEIDGQTPIGPSAIAINQTNVATNQKYPVPHELTIAEIKDVVNQFKQGAINAKQAGFDGLELHGANGYLVDQFLRDSSNHRTDIYGGSIENRCRFALEVIDALVEVFGSKKVSIRLSPTGRFNDMYDSNPLALLTYLLPELDKRNLAFVEIKRHSPYEVKPSDSRQSAAEQIPDFFPTIRKLFKTDLIANDSVSIEEANKLINGGIVSAVAFGTLSISNPDLPYRVKHNLKFNESDYNTYYSKGPKGYTDYPIVEDNNKS